METTTKYGNIDERVDTNRTARWRLQLNMATSMREWILTLLRDGDYNVPSVSLETIKSKYTLK